MKKIVRAPTRAEPKTVVSFQAGALLHEKLLKAAIKMNVSKSDAIRILLERGLHDVPIH